MIADKLLQVSSDQAITATAVSENTIDLQAARDIGAGESTYFIFTVKEAFATGTSLTFQIISSASADLSSATVITASGAVATANLAIGDQVALRLPAQVDSTGQRYLGANYVVAGSDFTAGEIDADVVLDLQDGQKYYASGFVS